MFFTSSAIAASKTRQREFEAASGMALPNEQLQSVLLRYAILESEACCTHSKIGFRIAAIRFCPHDTQSQRAGLPPAADGCANHGSTRRPMTGTLPVKCCATSGFHPCMISTGPVGWWPSAERALGEPARHGQLMVRITRCGDLLSPGT